MRQLASVHGVRMLPSALTIQSVTGMAEDVRDGRAEEISILAIGAILLRNRWRITRWAVAGALIALAIVWNRPARYLASASFIPQGADPTRSGLASLAGQFGVSVSSGSPTLTPDFYLRLLTSREVLTNVAHDTLVVPELGGRRVALEDLLDVHGGSPKAREEAAVQELTRRINASDSKSTGVVEFTVAMERPSVALAVARQLVDGVNEFNQRTRRDQAASERKFVEGRLAVATADLRAAEDRLQQFLQSNRQINSPDLQFARDRMQRDVTMRQQVFSTLTQAYDDVRMRELRDTPVITMVDEPNVPAKPESRGRAIRVVIGFLVGAALGALLAFIANLMSTRRAQGDPAATEFVSTVGEMTGGMARRIQRMRGRASA
jgi:uncharacterized protein involved in exopolysaccharide biosynthesis